VDVVLTPPALLAREAIERLHPDLTGMIGKLLDTVRRAATSGELEGEGDVRLPLKAPIAFRPGFPGARIVAIEAEVSQAGSTCEVLWVALVLLGGAGGRYPKRPRGD
jgi:hypothetical protein